MNTSELFEEVRRLMESGEMPDRVSNKLLWAQNATVIKTLKVINGTVEKHEKRIQYVETLGKIIGLAIIALAITAVFG